MFYYIFNQVLGKFSSKRAFTFAIDSSVVPPTPVLHLLRFHQKIGFLPAKCCRNRENGCKRAKGAVFGAEFSDNTPGKVKPAKCGKGAKLRDQTD